MILYGTITVGTQCYIPLNTRGITQKKRVTFEGMVFQNLSGDIGNSGRQIYWTGESKRIKPPH